MTVKNPLFGELPEISLTLEFGGTIYRFNGVYDGNKSLPSKILKLIDTNFEKGSDKQENM
ncbi:MAG: hypothetical protein LUJ25_10575 [Firmicutes bacterium]|nr:hypothetical protein [Bacillota bacterium]